MCNVFIGLSASWYRMKQVEKIYTYLLHSQHYGLIRLVSHVRRAVCERCDPKDIGTGRLLVTYNMAENRLRRVMREAMQWVTNQKHIKRFSLNNILSGVTYRINFSKKKKRGETCNDSKGITLRVIDSLSLSLCCFYCISAIQKDNKLLDSSMLIKSQVL